ncbi:fasciclin domain-containing protein [uncultured Clostridium sp.]|uniref:fasciclin domain-containing protein n=1 Tax=uncultured Clostridium sp. TaxID=59620 RepID=UPI0025E3CFCF|nr:fasciclin domain-containing protein [uncultured Clostridium sp.]
MKKILNFMILVLTFVLLIQTPLSVMAEAKPSPTTQNEGNKNNTSNQSNDNKSKSKDIVEIAKEDGRFKTLIAALDSAGLTEQLKDTGPFTVFAPTDEAFDKLPKDTLDNLLKPENKSKLADIISYHVSNSILNSKDIKNTDGNEVKTLNGKTLIVTKKNDTIFVNSSKVIVADIYAKNGIIHVIF